MDYSHANFRTRDRHISENEAHIFQVKLFRLIQIQGQGL